MKIVTKFLVLILALTCSIAHGVTQCEIDEEIEQLMKERNRARADAERYEDEAQRWQFKRKRFEDARQAWEKADVARVRQHELEEQIEALEKLKGNE